MTAFLRWFRLLPLTVAVAVLFLSVKVGSLWHDLGRTVTIGDASAAAEPPAAEDKKPSPVPPRPTAAEPTPAASAFSPARAKDFSASEIDVLEQLAHRREALAARAEQAERRESLLKAAEVRIDEKIEEMKKLQIVLEGLIKSYDGQQDAKIRSLVKIYENMKAKDAAAIFEELEMNTLLSVAERMNERRLAPILAELRPSRAKEITEELARLRRLHAETGSAAAAATTAAR
jgi:flagellar motility protein MotE (MotC chaperone)